MVKIFKLDSINHFNLAFMGKLILIYIASNNIANLSLNYDETSDDTYIMNKSTRKYSVNLIVLSVFNTKMMLDNAENYRKEF